MGKLTFVAGLAAGYVLGARAGRKRYEQIRTRAESVWASAPVQSRVETVRETVKDQAPAVAAKIGGVAKTVGAGAKERITGEDLPESLHRGTDGKLHADTSGYGPGGDKLP